MSKIKYLFLIFALSCAPIIRSFSYTKVPQVRTTVRTIPVFIDANFGQEDKLAIDDAINSWNYVLNGNIRFQKVDDKFNMDIPEIKRAINENGLMILKVFSSSEFLPAPDVPGGTISGTVDRVGGNTLYVVRDKINNNLAEIMKHEIGHILGAEHSSSGLMNPVYVKQYFQCVDKETAQQVANFNHLNINDMNYCYMN